MKDDQQQASLEEDQHQHQHEDLYQAWHLDDQAFHHRRLFQQLRQALTCRLFLSSSASLPFESMREVLLVMDRVLLL